MKVVRVLLICKIQPLLRETLQSVFPTVSAKGISISKKPPGLVLKSSCMRHNDNDLT